MFKREWAGLIKILWVATNINPIQANKKKTKKTEFTDFCDSHVQGYRCFSCLKS